MKDYTTTCIETKENIHADSNKLIQLTWGFFSFKMSRDIWKIRHLLIVDQFRNFSFLLRNISQQVWKSLSVYISWTITNDSFALSDLYKSLLPVNQMNLRADFE